MDQRQCDRLLFQELLNQQQWHSHSSCFVVVPILTIFFFFIHELVVDREDNGILFDNSLLLQTEFESVAMVCFVGIAGAVAILTIFSLISKH
jgi:hypothetical protein